MNDKNGQVTAAAITGICALFAAIIGGVFLLSATGKQSKSSDRITPHIESDSMDHSIDLEKQKTRTITIDNRGYVDYPAMFVSFERGVAEPIPKIIDGYETDADLWIEPSDPELSGLGSGFETGAVHLGRDTMIALAGSNFEGLDPESVGEWAFQIDSDKLVPGTVFVVRSSSSRLYKVRIDVWDRGVQDHLELPSVKATGGFVRLSYRLLDDEKFD